MFQLQLVFFLSTVYIYSSRGCFILSYTCCFNFPPLFSADCAYFTYLIFLLFWLNRRVFHFVLHHIHDLCYINKVIIIVVSIILLLLPLLLLLL